MRLPHWSPSLCVPVSHSQGLNPGHPRAGRDTQAAPVIIVKTLVAPSRSERTYLNYRKPAVIDRAWGRPLKYY